jgi:hypothetical protein
MPTVTVAVTVTVGVGGFTVRAVGGVDFAVGGVDFAVAARGRQRRPETERESHVDGTFRQHRALDAFCPGGVFS